MIVLCLMLYLSRLHKDLSQEVRIKRTGCSIGYYTNHRFDARMDLLFPRLRWYFRPCSSHHAPRASCYSSFCEVLSKMSSLDLLDHGLPKLRCSFQASRRYSAAYEDSHPYGLFYGYGDQRDNRTASDRLGGSWWCHDLLALFNADSHSYHSAGEGRVGSSRQARRLLNDNVRRSP